MHLNHPTHSPPRFVEKLSSMKLVRGAKEVGNAGIEGFK